MESKAYSLVKQIKETGALFNADHIYCNPILENENNKKETVNNLKSMLILHLEVVKEQADQLLSKDKLIAKLKQENDELKGRLEKYEQRRSQHQAKRMSSTTKNSIKTLPTTEETMVVAPTTTTNNNINNRKTKGRSSSQIPGITTINHLGNTNNESENKSLCSDNVAYRNNCVSPMQQRKTPADVEKSPNKRRKIDRRSQNEQTPVKGQSNSSPAVDPYEFTADEPYEPKHLRPGISEVAASETVVAPTAVLPVETRKVPRNAFITTGSGYILCDWKKSDAELDAEVEPLLRASLEIPSWSIKERHQCTYSIEGTEDLTNDTFTKRHTKFETDERRRKKWDVQRLREQKQVERLKKRYLKDEYDEKDPKLEQKSITSFYPSADNIKYIQIVEELPVLAFGEPIPCLPESDFALSWMSNTDKLSMSPTTSFTKTRFFSKKK